MGSNSSTLRQFPDEDPYAEDRRSSTSGRSSSNGRRTADDNNTVPIRNGGETPPIQNGNNGQEMLKGRNNACNQKGHTHLDIRTEQTDGAIDGDIPLSNRHPPDIRSSSALSNYTGKQAVQPRQFKKSAKKKKKKRTTKCLDDLLPPAPTQTIKQGLLHDINFSIVDEHALQTPKRYLFGSFFDLVEYLTDDDAWDDLVKARTLFRWMTSYGIMDMKIDFEPPQNSPLEYFLKIQCDLGSYANLYFILCQIANVPCVVIEGVNKNDAYNVGDVINKEATKAQWNAVYVYDEWHHVDTFWAVACAKNVEPLDLKSANNSVESSQITKPNSKNDIGAKTDEGMFDRREESTENVQDADKALPENVNSIDICSDDVQASDHALVENVNQDEENLKEFENVQQDNEVLENVQTFVNESNENIDDLLTNNINNSDSKKDATYVELGTCDSHLLQTSTQKMEETKSSTKSKTKNGNKVKSKQKNDSVTLTEEDLSELEWQRDNDAPIDEHYFFTNPSEIISTHLPDDDNWQLLHEPIEFQEFQNQAFIRERFYQLEISLGDSKYDTCVLESEHGETELVFSLPRERSKSFSFKYVLFRNEVTADNRSKLDKLLDRFVIFEHTEEALRFSFQFPISGRFKLQMYGLDKADEALSGYDLLCVYVLDIKHSENYIPLPDFPQIGWGPGVVSQLSGIVTISHKYAKIVTEDGILDIRIGCEQQQQPRIILKNPFANNVNLESYAMLRWNGNEFMIEVKLPEKGQYALKLFTKTLNDDINTQHTNVLNYLIKCTGENLPDDPFPRTRNGKLGKNFVADELGISISGYDDGVIIADNGYAHLKFEKPENILLKCEVYPHHPNCAERMRVTQDNFQNKQMYYLDLPTKGNFSMNVFAHEKGKWEDLPNTHSFLVKSLGREVKRGTLGQKIIRPFWDSFPLVLTETMHTKESEICVPQPRGTENVFAIIERIHSEEPATRRGIELVEERGLLLYKIQLPVFGEYVVDIFQRHENIYLKNIMRYHIFRSATTEKDLEKDELLSIMSLIREERLKAGQDVSELDMRQKSVVSNRINGLDMNERIQRAQKLHCTLLTRNPDNIRRALGDVQSCHEEHNDQLVIKAKQIIFYEEAKKDLTSAYKARDLEGLECAIHKAKLANSDDSLTKSLLLATRLRGRLLVLQRLRDTVLEVDYKSVGELKHYDNPPDGVHRTVKATLVLLGHLPDRIKSWSKCQAILGKTGKDYIIERMADFNPKTLPLEAALHARDMLQGYEVNKIHAISPVAAGFYNWAKRMIREVQATAGTLNS